MFYSSREIEASKEHQICAQTEGGWGVSGPQQTADFLEGYGDTAIDPVALAYYQYAWAVQDIAAHGETVLFLPDLRKETRRHALRGFRSLFEPGNIVSLALASDYSGT